MTRFLAVGVSGTASKRTLIFKVLTQPEACDHQYYDGVGRPRNKQYMFHWRVGSALQIHSGFAFTTRGFCFERRAAVYSID